MRFAIGFLGLILLALFAQAEAVPTGRLVGKVACAADATQTYALYAPSHYTPAVKWPAIFCFDPMARGQIPVERLQAAAEKFGYIVAGSNNSRNGPWAANVTAIQAMVLDAGAHLSIDPNRIYTAGLSGGARVATQLALAGMSKGVIACSAGFPASDNIPNRVPFPFFGTAGTEDFNYPELKRLDDELDDRGAAHRIVIFEGGHEWASAALLTDAVEWLELQAMRTGTRPRDDGLIEAALKTRLAAVEPTTGGEAWIGMKSIAADFKGLVDTGEYERKTKDLAASRAVKDWRKAEHALAMREDDLVAKLAELGRGASDSEIRRTAEDVRRKAEAADDSAERRMARRAIGSVAISVREGVRTLFDQQSYGEAASLLALFAALRPGQARTYYDLARARAFDRETKSALDALAQAAAAGFSDAARVEAEPAFARLKNEPAFQAALAAIRANPVLSAPPSSVRP